MILSLLLHYIFCNAIFVHHDSSYAFLCPFDCTIVSIKTEFYWDFKTTTCPTVCPLSEDYFYSLNISPLNVKHQPHKTVKHTEIFRRQ